MATTVDPPSQPRRRESLSRKQSAAPPATETYPALESIPLLTPSDFPHTTVSVPHSQIRVNSDGEEVLSFVIHVDPGNGGNGWDVEKSYAEIMAMGERVRSSASVRESLLLDRTPTLPDRRLMKKSMSPVKADQRKVSIQSYIQNLVRLPDKNDLEVVTFLTSRVIRLQDQQKMEIKTWHKEGYLMKRGKNLGAWKTRYFVLRGSTLEYYSSREGRYLGSINLIGTQLGSADAEDQPYIHKWGDQPRHALSIVEKRKPEHTRHILCAESDQERDDWLGMMIHSWFYNWNPSVDRHSPSKLKSTNSTDTNLKLTGEALLLVDPASSSTGHVYEVDSGGNSQFSLASSRTESTDYGVYCRRMGLSQETLTTLSGASGDNDGNSDVYLLG